MILLVAVTMSMVTLALADSKSIFNCDGGDNCTKTDTEAAEHKCTQARAVSTESLLFVAPSLVPTDAVVLICRK